MLTFLFALALALGSFGGLAILATNCLHYSGMGDHVSWGFYAACVIYSEIPLSFLCVFVAGLFVRSRPLLLAVLFSVIKCGFRLACLPQIITLRPFWVESILSVAAAVAGAWAAVALARRGGRQPQPLHPAWAALAALILPAVIWITMTRLATGL